MEVHNRLYLVSFGDSRQYRFEAPAETGDSRNRKSPFLDIEKELNDYLSSIYPGETFAFFTSPKVVELAPEHRAEFEKYPPLDADALKEIEAVLKTEVANRADQQMLDSDAPFNTVAPEY